jgi:hypothetical protein
MIAAMKFWIHQSNIDGFRCDVAWNVPDSFWRKAIAELRSVKTIFMLAEGEKPGLNAAGFDVTYAWSVMNIDYGIFPGKNKLRQIDPSSIAPLPESAFRRYHDELR